MSATTRRPTAERQAEIARAALEIVGRNGIAALTAATLAREIGVTSGALFRHFASRDEILDASVSHAIARIEETFPDGSIPPLRRVMTLARNRVALLSADRGLAWLLRSEQAYHSLPPGAVERLSELAARSKRFLLEAIGEGARDGSIRDDVDPAALTVLVMGTIHALTGLPGVQGRASAAGQADPARVLDALEHVLAPPAAVARARRSGGTKRRRTPSPKTRR